MENSVVNVSVEVMDKHFDRSAGRYCEHCGIHGSHHSADHNDFAMAALGKVNISQVVAIAESFDSVSVKNVKESIAIITVLLMDSGVNPFNVVMSDAFQSYINQYGDKPLMTMDEIQPLLPVCVSLAEMDALFHEVSFNGEIRYIARIQK